jgi:repressor LexA
MKDKLTDRQEEILKFIHEFKEENGYPPTLREIGKKFGITSTFGVKRHLDALVKKGYLHIESNASRGISFLRGDYPSGIEPIIEKNNIFNRIPVIGRVAAGIPLLAEENIEGNIVIDPSFIKKSHDCFALRVKGDSMINAGIFEGDFVIVTL